MQSRRQVLKSGLAMASMATSIVSPSARAADVNVRIMYWGSPDRVKRTNAVTEIFAKSYPGLTANAETSSDYWAKLNTMMAGGNMPDIVQLEPNTLPDYSRRSALISLDDFISKGSIRTKDLGKGILELGRVDNKMMGIAQSLNSFAMIYDKRAYAKAGIPEPTFGLTWEEYAKQAIEITKANGGGRYWASPYCARQTNVLQAWMMQRGKLYFTADQKLGFDYDDAREFYTYWENLRKAGGCTPADVSTKGLMTPDGSEMAQRSCSAALLYSNNLNAFSTLLPEAKLGIATFPITKKGGPSGTFYRPSLVWSISRDAKNIDAAVKFIDLFVNDINAGKALEVERGIPPNLKVRSEVMTSLNDIEKMSAEFISSIEKVTMPYPPASPAGAIEVENGVVRPIADQLAFGKITIDEAAKKLIEGAKRAIKQTS
ncbi:MAG: carbohydrate ABC transporter substrate-binding protein [Comamonadaceae bacterium]|nr:MAG: carbohydrate ABC transporter substrate-binding protein [Comamonadaceae bacterium]